MHYVKQFKINGVDTKQVACIELKGKPNTATEGSVGLLGIDMSSPLHEIYKCVAVKGSIYTWELFSSGMSIVSATKSGGGEESVQFPYDTLKTPATYLVKIGDLIIDGEGYLYQIDALGATYCGATYCGTQVVAYGKSAYDLAVAEGFEGSLSEWLASLKGEPGDTFETMTCGSYVGSGTSGSTNKNTLTFGFVPKLVIVRLVESYPDYTGSSKTYYADSFNNMFIWFPGLMCSGNGSGGTRYYSVSGKTLSWYTDNAITQLNRKETTYNDDGGSVAYHTLYRYSYVAFG
jgi:hypothetical protein